MRNFRPLNQLMRRSQRWWTRALWLIGSAGLTLTVSADPSAPASHGKTSTIAPAANVSRIQAWKDAELIASLAPGRAEVVGAGDSMKPVYGENTILVISRIAFEDIKPAMNVVYTNRHGKLVVHQVLAREAAGWRVQGINNAKEDRERVTRENLRGVVYASLTYSDEKKP